MLNSLQLYIVLVAQTRPIYVIRRVTPLEHFRVGTMCSILLIYYRVLQKECKTHKVAKGYTLGIKSHNPTPTLIG
jgi:hypothetical protein